MDKIESPRFRRFIDTLEALAPGLPSRGLGEARAALAELVAHDDWLPAPFRQPGESQYRQYLLARDVADAYSVVSFVWGPGQETPIHDHGVWGLVGILSGAEIEQRYHQRGALLEMVGDSVRLDRGDVSLILPDADIHRVRNALADRVSVSIHVYGADIGSHPRRSFNEQGAEQRFVSGYSEVFPS